MNVVESTKEEREKKKLTSERESPKNETEFMSQTCRFLGYNFIMGRTVCMYFVRYYADNDSNDKHGWGLTLSLSSLSVSD